MLVTTLVRRRRGGRGDRGSDEHEGRHAEPRGVLDAAAGADQADRASFKKTPQGAGISIKASYGPSSAQGQAVANGLPADGVILNTGNDINDLVDKGLISPKWDKQSYNGVVWNSVVVFGLRDGNPKKVKAWNDLVRPGVGVVTVNPFTGGIAKWNILASYVAQRKTRKTEAQSIAWLQKFYKNNVVAQESSGSNGDERVPLGPG